MEGAANENRSAADSAVMRVEKRIIGNEEFFSRVIAAPLLPHTAHDYDRLYTLYFFCRHAVVHVVDGVQMLSDYSSSRDVI